MSSAPFLFALAIEPLAIALGHCMDFKGIQREDLQFKMSLYADDLLLCVSNPTSSIPCILYFLNQFGKIYGYQLNLQKSELLPLNSKADEIPSNLFFPLKGSKMALNIWELR